MLWDRVRQSANTPQKTHSWKVVHAKIIDLNKRDSHNQAHKRDEFGVKASAAVTERSNFVVGGMALPGNPYDGHALKPALGQVRA